MINISRAKYKIIFTLVAYDFSELFRKFEIQKN